MTVAAILAIYCALASFVALLKLSPDWWLSQHLFSSWGPRTDVRCMTRRELFASGLKFLALALFCLGFFLIVSVVAPMLGLQIDTSPTVATLFFASAIFVMMGTAAGLYLLLRSLFRSRRYVLPGDCTSAVGSAGTAVATVPSRPPLPAPQPQPAPAPGPAST
jgi:hypothetical protein